ncbi:MAG: hypothetical protein HYY24_22830 [Verrucomicrobia bacterium]|nr:hypothetical protein [Verrucomicrobiota bacterium]
MSTVAPETFAAGIWQRAVRPEAGGLSPEQARALLEINFSELDLDRVDALCAKARAGTLTAEEKQELDEYFEAEAILGFLQSKARQSLKRAGLEP